MLKKKDIVIMAATLPSIICLGTAFAEEQQKGRFAIEEIVVTAQKRKQDVQDVPASVAVISGAQLENAGFGNYIDLLKQTSGLGLFQGQDPRTTVFTIRGIGSPGNIPGVEPSSAIIIDGETLSRTAQINSDLADIERVEVLKGPQGTLFGKNTSAGALHLITKRPSLDGPSGNIKVSLAEDSEYITKGSYNMVINDKSAFRVNGYYKNLDGWVQNVNSNEPNGGEEEGFGLRGQYLFDDGILSALVRLEYQEKEYGPYSKVLTELPPAGTTDGTIDQTIYDAIALSLQPLGAGNTRTSQVDNGRNYGEIDGLAVSAEISYDLGDSSIIYTGSWRNWDLFSNEDQSLIAVDVVPFYFGGRSDQLTTQHEIRWQSNGENDLNYVTGAFVYYNENLRDERWQECFPLKAGTVIDPVSLTLIDCNGEGAPYNTDVSYTSIIDTTNYALFGQVDYRVTENIVLLGGLRVLKEDQTMQIEGGFNKIPTGTEFDTNDTAVIGKAGIQYFLNDDAMLYATYTTGYKGEAWDNGIGRSVQDYVDGKWPIDAEESTQFEIGIRSDLFDNRLRLNLSAFTTDIEGFQDRTIFFNPAIPNGQENRLVNAGDVRTEGVEGDITFLVNDSFSVSGSFTVLDTTFTTNTFVGCPGGSQAVNCVMLDPDKDGTFNNFLNIKGAQLANAPEFSYNLSANYGFGFTESLNGTVRFDWRWLDDQLFNINQNDLERRDSYGVADLYLKVSSAGEKYSATIFVKNLFDKLYHERVTIAHISGYVGGSSVNLPRDYQRYIGANFSVSF